MLCFIYLFIFKSAPVLPPRKKKAVMFRTMTMSAYDDQLNAGFSE